MYIYIIVLLGGPIAYRKICFFLKKAEYGKLKYVYGMFCSNY